jgi:hypothetical protein
MFSSGQEGKAKKKTKRIHRLKKVCAGLKASLYTQVKILLKINVLHETKKP